MTAGNSKKKDEEIRNLPCFSNPKEDVSINSLKLSKRKGEEEGEEHWQTDFLLILLTLQNWKLFFNQIF